MLLNQTPILVNWSNHLSLNLNGLKSNSASWQEKNCTLGLGDGVNEKCPPWAHGFKQLIHSWQCCWKGKAMGVLWVEEVPHWGWALRFTVWSYLLLSPSLPPFISPSLPPSFLVWEKCGHLAPCPCCHGFPVTRDYTLPSATVNENKPFLT